jgi:hypothetical protein
MSVFRRIGNLAKGVVKETFPSPERTAEQDKVRRELEKDRPPAKRPPPSHGEFEPDLPPTTDRPHIERPDPANPKKRTL